MIDIPKLLRLGLHWGTDCETGKEVVEDIPKLLRLGLHWGERKRRIPSKNGEIPKLLRLGLHWGTWDVDAMPHSWTDS